MKSCQCQGIEIQFDSREAARKLAGYQKNGPAKTTRILISALKEVGVEGRTLLDIGGGIGAIQMEMLKAGAHSAVSVEASMAYLEAGQKQAQEVNYLWGWTNVLAAKAEGHARRGEFRIAMELIKDAQKISEERKFLHQLIDQHYAGRLAFANARILL